MGNYRFRFSDMIPNAWFYKLKDMSKSRKQYNSNPLKNKPSSANTTSQNHNNSMHRYSYRFITEPGRADKKFCNSPINPKASDTHFPEPPRKSSKKRSKRKTIYKPSPKLVSSSYHADCSCQATDNSVWTKATPFQHSPDYSSSPLESSSVPEFHECVLSEPDQEDDDAFRIPDPDSFDCQVASWSTCNCKISSSTSDIIIDMDDESFKRNIKKVDGFNAMSEVALPPILTKPVKFNQEMTREVTKVKRRSSKLEEIKAHGSLSVKIVKEESIRSSEQQKTNAVTRKSLSNSTGIRLRANSPKIASRKIQAHARKSFSSPRNKTFSDSFAVVKSSVDPQRDFRDSMVEMIVENNIRESKDLEDLLACYLSLNSSEYHHLIVEAFQQIWLDMTELCKITY